MLTKIAKRKQVGKTDMFYLPYEVLDYEQQFNTLI